MHTYIHTSTICDLCFLDEPQESVDALASSWASVNAQLTYIEGKQAVLAVRVGAYSTHIDLHTHAYGRRDAT
jgi:hypothetical protein